MELWLCFTKCTKLAWRSETHIHTAFYPVTRVMATNKELKQPSAQQGNNVKLKCYDSEQFISEQSGVGRAECRGGTGRYGVSGATTLHTTATHRSTWQGKTLSRDVSEQEGWWPLSSSIQHKHCSKAFRGVQIGVFRDLRAAMGTGVEQQPREKEDGEGKGEEKRWVALRVMTPHQRG